MATESYSSLHSSSCIIKLEIWELSSIHSSVSPSGFNQSLCHVLLLYFLSPALHALFSFLLLKNLLSRFVPSNANSLQFNIHTIGDDIFKPHYVIRLVPCFKSFICCLSFCRVNSKFLRRGAN